MSHLASNGLFHNSGKGRFADNPPRGEPIPGL
jgi:hypothetical protein